MNTKRKPDNTFKTEDAEREYWSAHSPLDVFDAGTAKQASFPKLKPNARKSLAKLLQGITEENIHKEISTNGPLGKEEM